MKKWEQESGKRVMMTLIGIQYLFTTLCKHTSHRQAQRSKQTIMQTLQEKKTKNISEQNCNMSQTTEHTAHHNKRISEARGSIIQNAKTESQDQATKTWCSRISHRPERLSDMQWTYIVYIQQYYAFVLCIWQPYLFFLIYDHFCLPCLADIFTFSYLCQAFEIVHTCVSIQNTNGHFANFTSMTTSAFLVWQTYFFFLTYAFNFWNVMHICIYDNSNAYTSLIFEI